MRFSRTGIPGSGKSGTLLYFSKISSGIRKQVPMAYQRYGESTGLLTKFCLSAGTYRMNTSWLTAQLGCYLLVEAVSHGGRPRQLCSQRELLLDALHAAADGVWTCAPTIEDSNN